jgi:Tol biopolymer transport system component
MEGNVWDFAFSPNGKKIIFEFHPSNLEGSQLWIVNSDGTERKNLTEGMEGMVFSCLEWSPSFSLEGAKIIFGFNDGSQLWIVNTNGTGRKNITEGMEGKVNYYPTPPSISFDEKKVLFIFRKENLNPIRPVPLPGEELWIANVDVTEKKNLTEGMEGKVWSSYFSPDGKKIIFEFHPSNLEGSQLWIVNSDGTERKNLTEGMKGDVDFYSSEGSLFNPFSPDGKKIIFEFHPSNLEGSQLWIVNSDGTERKNLTEGMKGDGYFTSFILNGKKIIFSLSLGFDSSQLWIVNSDGTERKNLTESMEGEVLLNSSSFSPDGKRIIATFEPKDSLHSFYREYWLINLSNRERKKIEINKVAEITGQYKIEDLIWLLY